MSADRLRDAARLMRERAEAATSGPWTVVSDGRYVVAGRRSSVLIGCDEPADAKHAASWHPVVAVAVADWLDKVADDVEISLKDSPGFVGLHPTHPALVVANAYLGDAS